MSIFSQQGCPIQVGFNSGLVWAEAPSNIALIKYMGQRPQVDKLPANPSLSLTLPAHRARVELEPSDHWSWAPLKSWGCYQLLTESQQIRFMDHARWMMMHLGINEQYCIRSATNFAPMCGLASSAASFAALTAAIVGWVESVHHRVFNDLNEVASLSRRGSGSSCRSFLGPWVHWSDDQIEAVEGPECHHQCIVVSDQPKAVSSSQAHQQVLSSPMFKGRAVRAIDCYTALQQAFKVNDWRLGYELVWQEFWDMHTLFHTAQPCFQYMTIDTLSVLNRIQAHWFKTGDGPWVTLDAGANVHCLYRPDQSALQSEFFHHFSQHFQVI